jgi:hypothetical protein
MSGDWPCIVERTAHVSESKPYFARVYPTSLIVVADDLLEVDVAVRRDLAGDNRQASRDERFARHARDRILGEDASRMESEI